MNAMAMRGRHCCLQPLLAALVVMGATAAAPSLSVAAEAASTAAAAPSAAAENGTDPTVFLAVVEAKHEYLA